LFTGHDSSERVEREIEARKTKKGPSTIEKVFFYLLIGLLVFLFVLFVTIVLLSMHRQ
jgi:hypothetical protein